LEPNNTSRLRKRSIADERPRREEPPSEIEINIRDRAMIAYSAEDTHSPVENLLDGQYGPGGTRWASGRLNMTERIVLEFDHPERISALVYEVEECFQERTQEVRVEVSVDSGRTWRHVLIQEYNFSPRGATFQREELRLELAGVTHLRLTIVPNKSGSGVATLTALRLFA
jgi:hypothetical protein